MTWHMYSAGSRLNYSPCSYGLCTDAQRLPILCSQLLQGCEWSPFRMRAPALAQTCSCRTALPNPAPVPAVLAEPISHRQVRRGGGSNALGRAVLGAADLAESAGTPAGELIRSAADPRRDFAGDLRRGNTSRSQARQDPEQPLASPLTRSLPCDRSGIETYEFH